MGRRYFGNVRKLPSGRFQARYRGPDRQQHSASVTFDTAASASRWLDREHAAIAEDRWVPPAQRAQGRPVPVTVRSYAESWLAGRELAATTRYNYRRLLDHEILPELGDTAMVDLTPAGVRAWHSQVAKDRPSLRAHAYGLLSTICAAAVADEVIGASPCRVRGAGRARRARQIRPATLGELAAIAQGMPERYRVMVLLAAWCALRFGELAELRRGDLDLAAGVVRVRRGVTQTRGAKHIKAPKSDAGRRDVHIPPHVMPAVRDHLRDHVAIGPDALLFPSVGDRGAHLARGVQHRLFKAARKAAGRPDLRFHDLRHTGAVLAAAAGATLAELMARLGHSNPAAALIYQHAAADRDKAIAAALTALADATVTPLNPETRKDGSG